MNAHLQFSQFGYTDGVSAVLLTSLDYTSTNKKFAIIGTNTGNCSLFCFTTYKNFPSIFG